MLLHPSTGVEREYEAVVAGTVDMTVLGPRLAAGVTTADGDFAANLLSCELLTEVQRHLHRQLALLDRIMCILIATED